MMILYSLGTILSHFVIIYMGELKSLYKYI